MVECGFGAIPHPPPTPSSPHFHSLGGMSTHNRPALRYTHAQAACSRGVVATCPATEGSWGGPSPRRTCTQRRWWYEPAVPHPPPRPGLTLPNQAQSPVCAPVCIRRTRTRASSLPSLQTPTLTHAHSVTLGACMLVEARASYCAQRYSPRGGHARRGTGPVVWPADVPTQLPRAAVTAPLSPPCAPPLLHRAHAPAQPQGLPSTVKVVQVAAGEDNALALTDDGDVWGWGDGQNGQLCRSLSKFNNPPGILTGARKAWKRLASSEDFALLLHKSAWGKGAPVCGWGGGVLRSGCECCGHFVCSDPTKRALTCCIVRVCGALFFSACAKCRRGRVLLWVSGGPLVNGHKGRCTVGLLHDWCGLRVAGAGAALPDAAPLRCTLAVAAA